MSNVLEDQDSVRTLDASGNRTRPTLLKVARRPMSFDHPFVHIVLSDRREF